MEENKLEMIKDFLEKYGEIPLDDNSSFFQTNNMKEIVQKTKKKIVSEAFSNRTVRPEGVMLDLESKYVEVLTKAIFDNMSIFYDEEEKEAYGVFGEDIVKISPIMGVKAQELFLSILKTELLETRESVFKVLVAFWKTYMFGKSERLTSYVMDFANPTTFFHKPAREEIKKGIELFLPYMKKIIEEKNAKIPGTNFNIRNGKYKSFMANVLVADMISHGFLSFEQVKEAGIINAISEEEMRKIYLGEEKGKSPLDPLDMRNLLIARGISKDYVDASRHLYENYHNSFMKNLTTGDGLVAILYGIMTDENEIGSILKKYEIDDISLLPSEVLVELFSMNLPVKSAKFLDDNSKIGKKPSITRSLLLKLSRVQLMSLYNSNRLVYDMSLTPEDIINLFNPELPFENTEKYDISEDKEERGLSLDDIIYLRGKGVIKASDFMKLVKYEKDCKNPLELFQWIMGLYDGEMLEEMLANGEMNARFIESFNKIMRHEKFQEDRGAYLYFLRTSLSEVKDAQKTYLELQKKGLDIDFLISISHEKVEDMYLGGEISEQDIFEFYQKGIISANTVKRMFTDKEIIDLIRAKKMSYLAFNLIDGRTEKLKEVVKEKRIGIPELVGLYVYQGSDGIGISEFEELTREKKEETAHLVDILPVMTSLEKIKELANHWYISQDDLGFLVERGMLTEARAEKIEKEIASPERNAQLLEELTDSGILIPEEEAEVTEDLAENHRKGNRPELKRKLFEQLGFDEKGMIASTRVLNGYSMYFSEELGSVALFHADKISSSTYIMSIQQAGHLLKHLGDGELGGETEHFKAVNFGKDWGANVVNQLTKVSEQARQKLEQDGSRTKKIKQLVREIREDYRSK